MIVTNTESQVPQRAIEKQYVLQNVGFQTMENLDPNGVAFDALGVFGLDIYSNE